MQTSTGKCVSVADVFAGNLALVLRQHLSIYHQVILWNLCVLTSYRWNHQRMDWRIHWLSPTTSLVLRMPFRPEIRQRARQQRPCMKTSSYIMVLLPSYIVTSHKPLSQRMIRHRCKMTGIRKTRTTPYHPMSNGQVERFNQTLLQMLGFLDPCRKSVWKTYVPPLIHAYNATRYESTGFCMF